MTRVETSVRVVVEELVVVGRTRQWADRFRTALELELALDIAGIMAPSAAEPAARSGAGPSATGRSLPALAVAVPRADRRDPGRAAAAVAADIARALSDGQSR